MPSLFRFLTVLALFLFAVAVVLYILAIYFEPVQREVAKPVPNVKIERK